MRQKAGAAQFGFVGEPVDARLIEALNPQPQGAFTDSAVAQDQLLRRADYE